MSAAPIVGLPYISKVGPNQQPLYFFTSTKVTQDNQGKVNGGETTLYYSPSPRNYIPAAITKDGGKTWEYLKDSNGNFILGDDTRKSLQQGSLKTDTNRFIKDAAQKSGIPEVQAKTLQLNQNTASSNAPEANNEGSALAEKDIATQRGNTRDSFRKDLVYPLSLRQGFQDRIQFNMIKFRPRSLQTGGNLNPIGDRPTGDIIGTVTLPIPAGISDGKTVNWIQDELDPFKALGVDIAQTSIVQGIGEGMKTLGNLAQAASNNSGDLGAAVSNALVQAATGTQNILSRTRGVVVNPNMELLFNGPQLRPFNFTFKMSARSSDEAVMIRNIIRFFKQGMSPIRTEANLFLKAPHTFQIKYLHKNEEHKFLNKFKEAALTSFTVDYTPEGQYATFTDGAMVSYQITMQFTELEPVFNDEYGVGGGNSQNDSEIGY